MLTWAWSGNERGPTLRSRLGEERSIHADSMKDATKTERWVDWINGRQRVSERWEPGFFFSFWMEKRSMGGFYEVLYIERPWIVLAIWEESARKDSEEGMNHHVLIVWSHPPNVMHVCWAMRRTRWRKLCIRSSFFWQALRWVFGDGFIPRVRVKRVGDALVGLWCEVGRKCRVGHPIDWWQVLWWASRSSSPAKILRKDKSGVSPC